jgi:hypothetical protein
VIFERFIKQPDKTFWANCENKLNPDGSMFVSVINESDKPIKMRKITFVDSTSEVDSKDIVQMDEVFDYERK